MRRAILTLTLLSPALPAGAAVLVGGDYAGGDLVPASGDVLQGTFTNVGKFYVQSGRTVYVSPGIPLAVYASTVNIEGVLDGKGRGQLGGSGGGAAAAGVNGFGAGPGSGAVSPKGGGGGGGGNTGGAGGGGAAGGAVYGSTGTAFGEWMSSDDSLMGSGGGGGGGGNNTTSGGNGAAGGASIYIEASSMSLTGSILASGENATAMTATVGTDIPGAGGGGGGGTILLRVPGAVYLYAGAALTANGGKGGDLIHMVGGTNYPGGGGAGGRVKIFYGTQGVNAPTISVTAGAAGGVPLGGGLGIPNPVAGSPGTSGSGVISSSPTLFAAAAVHVTSVSWSWSHDGVWGDASAETRGFRVYSSSAPPDLSFKASAAAAAASVYEGGLSPNATCQRWISALTDWGDSLLSYPVSTHTLASEPGSPSFADMAATSLSFQWTSGGDGGNPDYTEYQVRRSTHGDFSSAVSTGYRVALSSSPAGLTPNTTYYFQVRARNADGVFTGFTASAGTSTLAEVPSSPGFAGVYITSVAFSWSAGDNPSGTLYRAEYSANNFATVAGSSLTPVLCSTFTGLSVGNVYTFRVAAINRNSVPSAYSAEKSTVTGVTSDTSSPVPPGAPEADRRYSYDGTATFAWTPATSASGINDYYLEIGTSRGGSDFFAGSLGNVLTYNAAGMATSRTYYARVKAQNNGGIWSQYSSSSEGLPVYRSSQESALAKPINWPNPFDPETGSTQIGFDVSEPATVTLRIYTLQGALLHEETRRLEAAGNQIWTWNGRNGSGGMAAPGGYIGMIEKRYDGRSETQRFKLAVVY
jgi:hypothetical protein